MSFIMLRCKQVFGPVFSVCCDFRGVSNHLFEDCPPVGSIPARCDSEQVSFSKYSNNIYATYTSTEVRLFPCRYLSLVIYIYLNTLMLRIVNDFRARHSRRIAGLIIKIHTVGIRNTRASRESSFDSITCHGDIITQTILRRRIEMRDKLRRLSARCFYTSVSQIEFG